MVTSQSVLDRYQMTNEEEMLGFTDYDINPQSMAERYVQDDERLLNGEPLQNIANFNRGY
ncbi:MAG: hypothetical protein OSB19_17270 [Opitutaceae bacterium]|nr:hypothetical protein [Opitutaceae bacterium]